MKNKLFFIIVITQILILSYLGIKVFNKQKNILGKIQVNPIKKEFMISTYSGTLRYFYERMPEVNEEQKVIGDPDKKAYYTINKDSLNERYDYFAKKSDSYRILTLGDSYTFGMFVDTKNNYPEQLEDRLNNLNCENYKKFEVINIGEMGYDIQFSVERFRIRGQKYNPDLLIWLLKDDDFLLINEFLQPEVERLKKAGYAEFDEKSIKWPAIEKATENINQRYSQKKLLSFQKNFIQSIRNYYQGQILFVSLSNNSEYNEVINNFVKSDEKSFLFLTDKLNKSYLRFVDTHPNEKGHQILSAEINNFLLNRKIITCN